MLWLRRRQNSNCMQCLFVNFKIFLPEKTYLRGSVSVWLTCLFSLDSVALLMLNESQFYLFGLIQTSETGGKLFVQSYFPIWWVVSGSALFWWHLRLLYFYFPLKSINASLSNTQAIFLFRFRFDRITNVLLNPICPSSFCHYKRIKIDQIASESMQCL